MMPKPRLLPETGNGNIRDCGESVVNSSSNAMHPPESPTNNPEPNSKWHNPPPSTPRHSRPHHHPTADHPLDP